MAAQTTFAEMAERYLGPIGAWALNTVAWVVGGASPLAVLGTLAALWWTVERVRTERAKRRILENAEVTDPEAAKRLIFQITEHGK